MTSDDTRPQIERPGLFGQVIAADARRSVFDSHNEQLIGQHIPIDVVFAGDSITEMWALDAHFDAPSGLIVNRGISGDTTPYLRRRFESDVLQLHARLLVLLIGINNTWVLDGWEPPESLPTPRQIAKEITEDIEAMVQAASTDGLRVALCSLLPTDIWPLTTTSTRNRLVADVNDRLRNIASEQGVIYVDYHGEMTFPDGLTLRPGLADDGLHPHIVGYRSMARTLLTTLARAGSNLLSAR